MITVLYLLGYALGGFLTYVFMGFWSAYRKWGMMEDGLSEVISFGWVIGLPLLFLVTFVFRHAFVLAKRIHDRVYDATERRREERGGK